MSAQTLAITYAALAVDRIDDPYWIRIEQLDIPDDAATVADAAAVLDALFSLDPCETENEEEAESETAEAAEPAPEEEFAERVAEAIDLSFCKVDPDGSTETRIRIIRSHLAEPYRLQLQGGELLSTIQQQETVTVRLEITSMVTLDFPVVGAFTCTPAPLRQVGNTLAFAEEQSGRTLTATYATIYDVATIRIAGVDGEPGECRALAFCHGLVADETLETPEVEELDYSLCPDVSWNAPGEDEVTCYREITVRQRCSCSGDIISRATHEETTACPEELRCPNNETNCMHLLGSDSVDQWVLCPGDDDSSANPAFYARVCCRPPAVSLPPCHHQRTTWGGGMGIEHGAQHYRDLYGPTTRIMPLSPPGGICGQWIIDQRRLGDDCCANALELTFPAEDRVVAPGAIFLLVPDGGVEPFVWTTADFVSLGNGLFRAPDGFCGRGTVTVRDACDQEATCTIRSTAGRWVDDPFGWESCDTVSGVVAEAISSDCVFSYPTARTLYTDAGERYTTRFNFAIDASGPWACPPLNYPAYPAVLPCGLGHVVIGGKTAARLLKDAGLCPEHAIGCNDLGLYASSQWSWISEWIQSKAIWEC